MTYRAPAVVAPSQTAPAVAPKNVLTIGLWRVDCAARIATNGADTTRLSPRAIAALHVFATAKGEAVSRETLMDAIWPNVIVGDESLTQVITELRRAFGARGDGRRMIETIPRFGYRLIVPAQIGASADEMPGPVADRFDLSAYQFCLESRLALFHGGIDAITKQVDFAQCAVQQAPDFAMAHADYGLALCFRWLYQHGDSNDLTQAVRHAQRAVELDPKLGIAYGVLAVALGAVGRTSDMRRAIEQGLSMNRQDADLHHFGARALFAAQDHRAAAILAERAMMLDPDDYRAAYCANRAARHFDPGRARRNAVYCMRKAKSDFEADAENRRARATYAAMLAELGQTEDALRVVGDSYRSLTPSSVYDVVTFTIAGAHDMAAAILSECVELGWFHPDWAEAEPSFADIRHHPRLRRANRMLGLA